MNNNIERIVQTLLGRNLVIVDNYSADIVFINLLVTAILSICIAYTYKLVHKGISYSQSYVHSIVIVAIVVSLAMMVIGNDITRAFALLGTFTIIRYRTAVKDPKDTAFIFISLVLGLATGSSNYSIAIVGITFFCLLALLLHYTNFGELKKHEYVLYLTQNNNVDTKDSLHNTFKKLFKSSEVINVIYNEKGELISTYNITFKKGLETDSAIKEIGNVPGVARSEILHGQNVVEF